MSPRNLIGGTLPISREQRQQETDIVQEHPGPNRWIGPRRQGGRAGYRFRQGDWCEDYRYDGYRAIPTHLGSVASSELEYAPIEYMKHAEAYAETVLGTVSAAANSAGVACEVLHAEHGHIYQAIIDAADARKCDLIVMASHGRRGVSAVVLGSQTVKVLTHSKIPVLVYREWMNLTIRTCAGGVSGWFSVLHCNGLFNAMLKVRSHSSRWLRVTFCRDRSAERLAVSSV